MGNGIVHMYDSVIYNFDRVSGLHDNGMMSLQMQNGDQTVETTAPENATDDNVTDIKTIYPLWSTDTDNLNDIDQMTNYKSMKDIRDELCKDTPQKTGTNKPYCKAQPHRASLGYPFCNTAAHTEATPTREGI